MRFRTWLMAVSVFLASIVPGTAQTQITNTTTADTSGARGSASNPVILAPAKLTQ